MTAKKHQLHKVSNSRNTGKKRHGWSLKHFNQIYICTVKILIFIFLRMPDFSIASQALKCNAQCNAVLCTYLACISKHTKKVRYRKQVLAEMISKTLLSWNTVTKLFSVHPIHLKLKHLWDDSEWRRILCSTTAQYGHKYKSMLFSYSQLILLALIERIFQYIKSTMRKIAYPES